MSEPRLQLPATLPQPDAPLELHDAELVRLTIENFGRRVRLALIASVNGGQYEQPVEVRLEGADYVFWRDATEDDGDEPWPVFDGGVVGQPTRYGSVAAHPDGLDYTLRGGPWTLTVVRARSVTTVARTSRPALDVDLTSHRAWVPLDVESLRRHIPDPRHTRGYQRLPTLALDFSAGMCGIVMRFDVAPPDGASWLARATYAGASSIELAKNVDADRSPGEVLSARLGRHASSDRLQLRATGMDVTIAGRDWLRTDVGVVGSGDSEPTRSGTSAAGPDE